MKTADPMEGWQESFTCLLSAIESLIPSAPIDLVRTSSRTSISSGSSLSALGSSHPSLTLLKRPREDSFSQPEKKICFSKDFAVRPEERKVATLSTRFTKTLGLIEKERIEEFDLNDDSEKGVEIVDMTICSSMPRSSPILNVETNAQFQKILQLSQLEHTSIAEMRDRWMRKLAEISRYVEMISNGPTGDFEDLKMVVNNILEVGHWLSAGDLSVITTIVPAWRRADKSVTRAIEYIQIVQDMKHTVNHPPQLSGQIMEDINILVPFITAKK